MRESQAGVLSVLVTAGAALAFGVAHAPPAAAIFHQMMVREVFAGTPATPTAQYVELQMWASGQRFVAGHQVLFYDAAGTLQHTETFTDNVDHGDDNSTILIATTQAEELFNVQADLELSTAAIAPDGGKVCFENIDCVSFGSYSGSATGTGTPFNAPEGIPAGATALRDVSGGGDPNGLDPGDDTDESAADFRFAAPSPRNNFPTTGVSPNGVLNYSVANFTVAEDGTSATITVNRSVAYATPTDVDYSTLPGTATADVDYTPPSGTLSFSGTEAAKTFAIPIADDDSEEGQETVLLRLRDPAADAVFGPRLNATLTIDDDEGAPPDETAPVSRITRPDHGSTYRSGRLTTLRGTAQDASPINKVQVALRMTRTNGSCRWFTGTRFVRGGCGDKRWKPATGGATWSYALHHSLPDSTGTKVRHYTLYSRATDAAGNIEATFKKARNANRFEIR